MIGESDLERGRRWVSVHVPHDPVLVGVTGSHFYGFPSPDSDLDLKGIFQAPTEAFLGLDPPAETIDAAGTLDGQEMDLTCHELGFALRLLFRGNGNILERLATPYQLFRSEAQQRLVELGRGAAARSFHRHYKGFFSQKRKDLEKAEAATVKGVLYVYRAALTGIHLMRTGECVGDALGLAALYGYSRVAELIEAKRTGMETAPLSDDRGYREDWDRLEAELAQTQEQSPLPEQSPNMAAGSALLIDLRRRALGC